MGVSSDQASYNKTLLEIQKLANNSAKTIQTLVNSSNTQQMNFNRQEAKTARDWEKMMSDTSHQREVKDLKKAGLNPVLSVNSGAQSYTTSSASTTNDSGASATAALLEGQLGAMTNLESARMSTQAQLKASKQQAAATRYAAQQSAAAQRYAAQQGALASMYHSNKQFEASKYGSNKQFEASKYSTDTKYKIAQVERGKSWSGLLDKWIEKTSLGSTGRSIVKRVVGDGFSSIGKLLSNPKKFYKESYVLQHLNKGVFTPTFKGLNKNGLLQLDKSLNKFGLTVNNRNRKLAFNAFVLKNQKAANIIFTAVHQRHHVTNVRRGHR